MKKSGLVQHTDAATQPGDEVGEKRLAVCSDSKTSSHKTDVDAHLQKLVSLVFPKTEDAIEAATEVKEVIIAWCTSRPLGIGSIDLERLLSIVEAELVDSIENGQLRNTDFGELKGRIRGILDAKVECECMPQTVGRLSFEELCKAIHWGSISNIIWTYIRGYEDVEDILQEAEIILYKNWLKGKIPNASAAYGFLKKTAIFKAIDLIRKKKRHPVISIEEPIGSNDTGDKRTIGDTLVGETQQSPGEMMVQHENWIRLNATIMQLKPRHRDILMFIMGSGKTPTLVEGGAYFNVPSQTYRNWLEAARQELGRRLKKSSALEGQR